MLNRILYLLSIVFGAAGKVGMIICGFYAGFEVISIVAGSGSENHLFLFIVLGFLCFLIDKFLFQVRTNARDSLEFDEYGNKKRNLYKNLSAKEKQEIDRQRLSDQERLLSSAELKRITKSGSKNPVKELQELVGLYEVKEEVLKMQAMMEYEKRYGKKGKAKGNHLCFLGSPGTGKTTVARIMTGILYQYKYIKKNQCIEIDGSFLKGATPDDTLRKTRMILQRSKNGVLFIDEAYSLLSGINSAEIIAELVKYMEDHKEDFVLILAGYSKEMENLINSNPGLHSRIQKYLWFKDYDITELKEIFRIYANQQGYYVDSGTYDVLEIRLDKERKSPNFGNARTVKNILNQSIEKHAYHIMNGILPKDKVYVICECDI